MATDRMRALWGAPLGFTKTGRPIWPVAGAAEGDPPATPPAPLATATPAPPSTSPPPPSDLGDAGKRALEEERKARRTADKERDALAARLKEFEDRDKTDAQKLEDRATRAEQALTPAQGEAQRLRFALDKASTLEPAQVKTFLGLVDRLRGTTTEELSADADALLALLGNAPPPPATAPPSFDGGARSGGTPPAASVASGAALYASRHTKPASS